MNRRSLLLGGLTATGALLVGWGALPPRSRLGSAARAVADGGAVALNGWLTVTPDGVVHLAMPRSEMGQGVHTALTMLVAEELDVPLSAVRLVPAGPDRIHGNVALFVASLPIHPSSVDAESPAAAVRGSRWLVGKLATELGVSVTGGSSSVTDAWDVLRLAAATARAQLLGAASLQWKLPVADLAIDNGIISHPSGPSGHFGEFARAAAATPATGVRVKDRKAWSLIGTAAPRTDLPAKVDGSAVFGLDVRRPGQLYAVVAHAPMLFGSPGRADTAAALALPGVERVVRLGRYAGSHEAVAVVGRTTWHARRGVQALDVEWRGPPAGHPDTRQLIDTLERRAREADQAGGGFAFHDRGDILAAHAAASSRHEAVYRAPYLAHAAMEPINCTARVADGRVELWAPTQFPTAARAIAAEVAGVDADDVMLHVTYLGGGFGRRLDVDFVGQAVRIAIETSGRPVQLVWPREEDLTHDFYRPAAVAVLRAAFDADGAVSALSVTSAGDAITPRWLERTLPLLAAVDTPDRSNSEGLFDQPYDIPHQRMAHVATHSGVPVGYWRSVGHSHNAFFAEGFIDELAAQARQDPLAFRLALLAHQPRHAAVLKLVADKSGWAAPLPPGRARGVALAESFGSIVAQVAEVVLEDGKPRVVRVVCAADVGTVVNPGIVAQQMEGAIVFGLCAALHQRIDIHDGVVQQSNFHTYRLLTLAETPRIETHLIASERPPSGVGEPGVPPVAPAVANAVFALTGQRLRALPLVL